MNPVELKNRMSNFADYSTPFETGEKLHYPADWKEAVKEKFAPRWFKRRWPVIYITYDLRQVCDFIERFMAANNGALPTLYQIKSICEARSDRIGWVWHGGYARMNNPTHVRVESERSSHNDPTPGS